MDPFTPQTQDSTVYQLAAQLMADAANDGDRARIDRALDLVATVERTPIRGLFLVPSASTEGGCYHVRHGLCNCPDAQRRDARVCKHATAVQLFQMVERAEVDAEQAECCIDCDDGGRESPEGMRRRCSNCPLIATWTDADRERGFQTTTITVDPEDSILDLWPVGDGEPCEIAPRTAGGAIAVLPLSPRAQALRAELYDDERPRPALRLVAVDGTARQ